MTFFHARCLDCHHEFDEPSAGDFSCGEFILCQERGQAFATLSAFSEPAFAHIRALLGRVAPQSASSASATIDRVHYVIARSASPVAQHRFLTHTVCPACFSRRIARDESRPTRSAPVPEASFAEFLALPPSEQTTRLEQLWAESDTNNA